MWHLIGKQISTWNTNQQRLQEIYKPRAEVNMLDMNEKKKGTDQNDILEDLKSERLRFQGNKTTIRKPIFAAKQRLEDSIQHTIHIKPLSSSEGLVDNNVTNSMTIDNSKAWPSCKTTSATWKEKLVRQGYAT